MKEFNDYNRLNPKLIESCVDTIDTMTAVDFDAHTMLTISDEMNRVNHRPAGQQWPVRTPPARGGIFFALFRRRHPCPAPVSMIESERKGGKTVADVETVHDLGRSFSGDAGYCHYKKSGRGVVVEWCGAKVVAVKCEHEICRYSDVCEIYKRHPVGYVQSFPNTQKPKETEP